MEGQDWWKPCIAEFVGAFALTFVGAGTIIATQTFDPGTRLLAIALAHGLAIAVMVSAVGHLSGGHFNPAVTVAALFTRKIRLELGLLYVIFQLLGSVFGAFLLTAAIPTSMWGPVHLGTPSVSASTNQAEAIVIEAVLTFFLVFVIFGVGMDKRNSMKSGAGLAIGFAIVMAVLMGGNLTGAALNPARAFGTALISRTWAFQLIYWAGPLLGAIIAGIAYDTAFLQKPTEPKPAARTPEPPPDETPPGMA